MPRRPRLFVLLLAASLLALLPLLSATDAEARGGRSATGGSGGSARGATPAPATPTEPEPAAPARPTPPEAEPQAPPTPTPPPTPSTLPPGSTGRRAIPRGGVTGTTGAASWVHWYEANRELYEDIRMRSLLTDTSPVFGVGNALGPHVGQPEQQLAPGVRREVLRALEGVLRDTDEHWLYTKAAAYVALGKMAVGASDVAPHLAALAPRSGVSAYLRESAALGLANLRRTDPAHRLPPHVLDRVRDTLLDVLGRESERPTTRAYAALALALLADQPATDPQVGPHTVARLFETWTANDLPDDVQVGILLGLARTDPAFSSRIVRLVLEGCALRGRDWPNARSPVVRAHALLALAELGDTTNVPAVTTALLARNEPALFGQAAAMAAARLGERQPAARGLLCRAVVNALAKEQEPAGRRLLLLALGRLLASEADHDGEYLLVDRHADRPLFAALQKGGVEERPFAALALALAARAVGGEVRTAAWHAFRRQALDAIRDAWDREAGDPVALSAYATALGLARDGNSASRLLARLTDADRPPELRAYAALGLGLMDDGRREVIDAITQAVRDPRSAVLQMRAATALGLLGGGEADRREETLALLIGELRHTPLQATKGQIAITLGRIGDGRAAKPLIEVLESEDEPNLNRTMACAALGLLGDEEVHPTFAETRWTVQYLASNEVVAALLDLL